MNRPLECIFHKCIFYRQNQHQKLIFHCGSRSSAGQSARFLILRPWVRIPSGTPIVVRVLRVFKKSQKSLGSHGGHTPDKHDPQISLKNLIRRQGLEGIKQQIMRPMGGHITPSVFQYQKIYFYRKFFCEVFSQSLLLLFRLSIVKTWLEWLWWLYRLQALGFIEVLSNHCLEAQWL